jgi:hypothetical protein
VHYGISNFVVRMPSTERVLSLASNTNYIKSAIGKHCCVMLHVCLCDFTVKLCINSHAWNSFEC